ncbi:MAG: hypothetical protein GY754_41545 [bacterium]|nr:hypothetical protein [bacterium]
MEQRSRIQRLQEEIRRKEKRAMDAKDKGMNSTYRNYLMDLAILRTQMQKLLTNSSRAQF